MHSINKAAVELEASRGQAGDSLVSSVGEVNAALSDIAELNERLALAGTDPTGTSGLMDEMNRRLDALGTQMDFQGRWEADGTLTLHTTGGTELVHGETAVKLSANRDTGRLMAGDVDITPNSPTARGSDSGRLAGLSGLIATICRR